MTIKEIKDNGLLLLECISGSKAYGLETSNSDTDIKGVFYLSKDHFYGLDYIPQVSNESNDEVYYELGRYIELLVKNNPNMLELLATPDHCILYKHPLMNHLSIDIFLSKLCKETFAGYAHSQIKKARGYKKKVVNHMEKERKDVLDFCFVLDSRNPVPLKEWLNRKQYVQSQCGLISISHTKGMYALFYDEANTLQYRGVISSAQANDVSLSSVSKEAKEVGYLYFNIESYSAYCKQYKEYWEWVEKRNEHRYQNNLEHGKSYDAKNMMHTIRLLQVAEEIGMEGKLNVKRNNKEELLAIKRGLFSYDELLQKADTLMERIENLYTTSLLQEYPNKNMIEKILINVRTRLYS